jgi:carbonic anhydrase/acetyltransferase-like protein (isoleucine patch superfamily)
MIISHRGKTPKIAPGAFIAPTDVLIGDVEVGQEASIWFGAVLRGATWKIFTPCRSWLRPGARSCATTPWRCSGERLT